jgi:hypothetical protein
MIKIVVKKWIYRDVRRGNWTVRCELYSEILGYATYTFEYLRCLDEQEVRRLSGIKIKHICRKARESGAL